MRTRIVTRVVAAAVLAICLFAIPIAIGVARYFQSNERSELERAADSAALSVADTLSAETGDPTEVTPTLPAAEPDVRLSLYTPAGGLRTGTGPKTADDAVRRAIDDRRVAASDSGGELVVAVAITDHGVVTGAVRAATNTTEIVQRTVLTWAAMLGLAVIAVLATWLTTRRMAAGLARPLEQLAQAANQLGEGDFTVRAGRAGIPEIDAVGSALDTTAARIGETLDRERAFSANASHQLRTPLAGLRLQLEAALESPNADPRAALAGGIAAADRLEAIIDDLLALARHTPAATDPIDPVDLDVLLGEVRAQWHGPLAAQGRPLRITTATPLARARASAAAIRQIIAVLVDNAATHGRGTISISARDTTDATDTAHAVAVDVTDDGPGVAPGQDPFAGQRGPGGEATAGGRDRGPGHGIGLALARSLAEAEGGRLLLTRAAPATFTLLLPATDPEPAA